MSISIVKPEEIKNEIMSFFKNKSIIPIVGAGLTCGIKSKNGQVPSGQLYKEHMIETLVESNKFTDEEKEEFQLESFSNICDYYEDDTIVLGEKRVDFWKKNFYRINMGLDYRKQFLDIDWPYIYSLNIDDAIENSSVYSKVILPNREFRSELLNEEKCVIKLHGDVNELVTYKVADKVFSSKEYALSIERNAAILGMLRNDFRNQNILFIGCSLDDEMDLKSIDSLPVDYQNKDNLSKTIIFVKGQPGQKMISKYKTYGITDVVCFDEYTEMYSYLYETWQASVYKGYKRDKIEMRGDRAEMSDFPLYLNTVAGGLDCRNQAIGGFSFVVKIYALPVVEIIGQFLYLLGRYGFDAQIGYCF